MFEWKGHFLGALVVSAGRRPLRPLPVVSGYDVGPATPFSTNFSSSEQCTDLASPLLLSIILANIFEFNAARTRRLAVASRAHAVAMIAGATHPPFDYSGAFTLRAGDLWGWCVHGGSWDCGKSLGEVEQSYGQLWGRLGSVMRYLGKRRVGLCPHLGLPRNNVCVHDLGFLGADAGNRGQDLWLDASMHPHAASRSEINPSCPISEDAINSEVATDWLDDLGEQPPSTAGAPAQRI